MSLLIKVYSCIKQSSKHFILELYKYFYYSIKFSKSSIDSWIGFSPKIEEPVKISRNVYLNSNVKIGKYTSINENCLIGKNTLSIGNYCSIAHDCIIGPNHHPIEKLSSSACFYSPT